MNSKELYVKQLYEELAVFDFKGTVEEEVFDRGLCFVVKDNGWSVTRSHIILKKIVCNLREFCRENEIDDSEFFILIE